jgi:hypothetical protein
MYSILVSLQIHCPLRFPLSAEKVVTTEDNSETFFSYVLQQVIYFFKWRDQSVDNAPPKHSTAVSRGRLQIQLAAARQNPLVLLLPGGAGGPPARQPWKQRAFLSGPLALQEPPLLEWPCSICTPAGLTQPHTTPTHTATAN